MERPALKRLMADVQAGRIDVVVVYKVDRLTRALTDFSRIVDVLDKAGSSFVSVTQAFNTTTSMGRLTLNVLLSFAQFEREVTGERIRDKIAASKKLGMWMGGGVPLGYDASGRTLTINEKEARTVRWVFERYLELGSTHKVVDELAKAGVVTKRTVSKSGTVRGGIPIRRGPLFHMLKNRTYVGEIPHKDTSYPGQHPAIIDRPLFDAVQALLSENDRKVRKPGETRKAHKGAPLTGLIYDTAGNRMSPTTARQKNKPAYRYYASTAVQLGDPSKAGAVPRVSAPLLEDLIAVRLKELKIPAASGPAADWNGIRDLIHRIEVLADGIRVELDRPALQRAMRDMPAASRVNLERVGATDEHPTINIKARMVMRGGSRIAIGPDGQPALKRSMIDPALSSALIRAEAWKRKILVGEVETLTVIAREEGVTAEYARRMIRPAYLAPDLKASILDGRQSMGLTLEAITKTEMPLDWNDQRRLYAGR
ncbi:MAG: recombinase family protein [Alphaproteobacteria bacterium]|nr:MAG: recombinase family protein [Alphaproteobacteria bacterium]PZO38221.1 MAG: recombinase family protein [Alphaproteobacteria bacterium]